MDPKGKGETLKGEAATLKVTILFQCRPGKKIQIGKIQSHTTGYTTLQVTFNTFKETKSILLTPNNYLAKYHSLTLTMEKCNYK